MATVNAMYCDELECAYVQVQHEANKIKYFFSGPAGSSSQCYWDETLLRP